jgi:ABC-type nitrate/sulfonate/bicarbonate transport systems, periplasmic components
LQNLGVVIIGDYADSLAEGKDVNAVVSLADSGIASPADLAGKRVGVNSIGAAGDVTIMKAVQDAGADPTTIQFVEVAFPDAQAQLEAGNIDAAWVPDPFMSMIVGGGGNLVVHPYQATIPGLSVLTTITTQKLMDSDPELVADFAAAMSEALDWAMDNEEAVRAAISTNMKIPEQAAAGITLPTFTSEITVSDLEELAGLAVDFGVLDAEPDFDRLVQQQ